MNIFSRSARNQSKLENGILKPITTAVKLTWIRSFEYISLSSNKYDRSHFPNNFMEI